MFQEQLENCITYWIFKMYISIVQLVLIETVQDITSVTYVGDWQDMVFDNKNSFTQVFLIEWNEKEC